MMPMTESSSSPSVGASLHPTRVSLGHLSAMIFERELVESVGTPKQKSESGGCPSRSNLSKRDGIHSAGEISEGDDFEEPCPYFY